ncbi:MAG: methyltransferase [Actinomycetia bacterium]|nr:methyltransferase [Actinomycetes bacterium]
MPPGQPTPHYFDAEPTVDSDPSTIRLTLADLTIELVTDRGVFSRERIDVGTRFLLMEGPDVPDSGHLLDLGCGYGPIALTLAHRAPEATVWAIDVNDRARDLCAANARRLGLDNVKVVAPSEVPAEVRFTAIWSNPPIRIGKEALHELLSRWLRRLGPDGQAHLVVQRHLGSDSLARWLTDQGWPTERRASRKGYRLLDVAARQKATQETMSRTQGPPGPARRRPRRP